MSEAQAQWVDYPDRWQPEAQKPAHKPVTVADLVMTDKQRAKLKQLELEKEFYRNRKGEVR